MRRYHHCKVMATYGQTERVAKGRAIALLLRKLVIINISAQSMIPNQKYVKNFGVNGLMGLAIKEYLSRLNVAGLTKLNN